MRPTRPEDQPYCRECGYSLQGLTESSKCPECGRPIVEVLVRSSFNPASRRYQSDKRLFGLPLVSIASGPYGAEKIGKAVGFIAIGDAAKGVIAIGGRAVGVVAIGGVSCGLFSIGGFSLGLLVASGGCAIGSIACGGFAAGLYAFGGLVLALVRGFGGQVIHLPSIF